MPVGPILLLTPLIQQYVIKGCSMDFVTSGGIVAANAEIVLLPFCSETEVHSNH